MVETVMLVPILLFITFWIIQFAMLFGDDLQLQYTAYQAARGITSEGGMDDATWQEVKELMPYPEKVNIVENDLFFTLDENSNNGNINVGVQLVALEYDSKVFFHRYHLEDDIDIIYGSDEATTSTFKSTDEITLHAICFAPKTFTEEKGVSKWDAFFSALGGALKSGFLFIF